MFSYYLVLECSLDTKPERRNPSRFIYVSVGNVSLSIMLLPIVNYIGMKLLDDIEHLPICKFIFFFEYRHLNAPAVATITKTRKHAKKMMCDRK